MSRVLRDNDRFFKTNEQTAFILVSDEDENDPAGRGCVRGYQNVQSSDVLIKGSCEERATVIKYGVATANAASCNTSYDAGYRYKYAYVVTTPAYDITYKKKSADASYVSPRTKVSYSYPSTSYYRIETNVDYYACDPVKYDNAVKAGACDYRLVKGSKLKGDHKADCDAATKNADQLAAIDGRAPAKPVCTVGNVPASSCANGDSTCGSTVKIVETSGYRDGVVSTADCATAARALNQQAITDGTKPLQCVSNDSTAQKAGGTCPANLVGCVTTEAKYADYTAPKVAGDYSGDACRNAKLPDQQPGTTPSLCAKNDIKRDDAKTGQIVFDGADGGQTLAVNAACVAINDAALADAVKQGAPAGGNCVITGYYQSAKGAGSTASREACAADAKLVTDASPMTKRNPQSQFTGASTGAATKQLAAVPARHHLRRQVRRREQRRVQRQPGSIDHRAGFFEECVSSDQLRGRGQRRELAGVSGSQARR